MFLWDRDTARLLHSFPAAEPGSNLTGIAWNYASRSLMFASASDDGTVRIWAEPPSSPHPAEDQLVGQGMQLSPRFTAPDNRIEDTGDSNSDDHELHDIYT